MCFINAASPRGFVRNETLFQIYSISKRKIVVGIRVLVVSIHQIIHSRLRLLPRLGTFSIKEFYDLPTTVR